MCRPDLGAGVSGLLIISARRAQHGGFVSTGDIYSCNTVFRVVYLC